MKQFFYSIAGMQLKKSLFYEAEDYFRSHVCSSIVAHVFVGNMEPIKAYEFIKPLKEIFPGIVIVGASATGTILKGGIREQQTSISISFFEYTRVKTTIYSAKDKKLFNTGWLISSLANTEKQCKAIEIQVATHNGLNVNDLFDGMEALDPNIAVFGGAAGKYTCISETFVFNENDLSTFGILAVFYCGAEFEIEITHALGWKELGHVMIITKSVGQDLYEIDGEPAFNVYKRYLNIDNDETFADNALEFPLMYKDVDIDIARIPLWCSEDGMLHLGGGVKEGDELRLGYGDPAAIKNALYEAREKERVFRPQGIIIYSCKTRKSFWKGDIDQELLPFEKISPIFGYYTFGEYIRIKKKIYICNAALVAIGIREGEPVGDILPKEENVYNKKVGSTLSMVERLVTFIRATTAELELSYEKLERANKKLEQLANVDALTGIYNRRSIEEIMKSMIFEQEESDESGYILLLDIDHFKKVNDTYGHDVGDTVLRKVASVIKHALRGNSMIGRWGGEEFLIVMVRKNQEEALKDAENIRTIIEETDFNPVPKITISIGLVNALKKESMIDIYKRVDGALYDAKNGGRNQVSTDWRKKNAV